MPGHYIHLSQRNMADRVRKDAGIDGNGNRVGVSLDDAGLDQLLKRSLKRLLLQGEP